MVLEQDGVGNRPLFQIPAASKVSEDQAEHDRILREWADTGIDTTRGHPELVIRDAQMNELGRVPFNEANRRRYMGGPTGNRAYIEAIRFAEINTMRAEAGKRPIVSMDEMDEESAAEDHNKVIAEDAPLTDADIASRQQAILQRMAERQIPNDQVEILMQQISNIRTRADVGVVMHDIVSRPLAAEFVRPAAVDAPPSAQSAQNIGEEDNVNIGHMNNDAVTVQEPQQQTGPVDPGATFVLRRANPGGRPNTAPNQREQDRSAARDAERILRETAAQDLTARFGAGHEASRQQKIWFDPNNPNAAYVILKDGSVRELHPGDVHDFSGTGKFFLKWAGGGANGLVRPTKGEISAERQRSQSRRRNSAAAAPAQTVAPNTAPAIILESPSAQPAPETGIAPANSWYTPAMAEKREILKRHTERNPSRIDTVTGNVRSPKLQDLSLHDILSKSAGTRQEELYFKVITLLDEDPNKKTSQEIIEKLHKREYDSFTDEHRDLLDRGIQRINAKRREVEDARKYVTPDVMKMVAQGNPEVAKFLRIVGPEKGAEMLLGHSMLELAVSDPTEFSRVIRGLKHIEKVTNSPKAKRINAKIEKRLAELGLSRDQIAASTHEGLPTMLEVHRKLRQETLGDLTGFKERIDKWADTLWARSRLISHIEAERALLRQCSADIHVLGVVMQASITPELYGDAIALARENRERESPKGRMNTLTQLAEALTSVGYEATQKQWSAFLNQIAGARGVAIESISPEEIRKLKYEFLLNQYNTTMAGVADLRQGIMASVFRKLWAVDVTSNRLPERLRP